MYRSFSQLKALRACDISRHVETARTPRCPYCLALYTSENEVRPEIDCIACQGKGDFAKQLESLVVLELEAARKNLDTERVSVIVEMFPDTYFAVQAKMILAALRQPSSNLQ